MNNLYVKLMMKLQSLLNNEEGQDLIEYALLVAIIAVAAISSTKLVAGQISTVFSSVASTLGSGL
jgi:pilus assembly protein Flp/PilA